MADQRNSVELVGSTIVVTMVGDQSAESVRGVVNAILLISDDITDAKLLVDLSKHGQTTVGAWKVALYCATQTDFAQAVVYGATPYLAKMFIHLARSAGKADKLCLVKTRAQALAELDKPTRSPITTPL